MKKNKYGKAQTEFRVKLQGTKEVLLFLLRN